MDKNSIGKDSQESRECTSVEARRLPARQQIPNQSYNLKIVLPLFHYLSLQSRAVRDHKDKQSYHISSTLKMIIFNIKEATFVL